MEIKSGNDNLDFSFNELESRINDKLIQETVRLNTEAENASMLKSYQSLLQEIKRPEADVFLWQVLADKITDRKNAFADVETLAVLFCEKIEFIMNKKEVSSARFSYWFYFVTHEAGINKINYYYSTMGLNWTYTFFVF